MTPDGVDFSFFFLPEHCTSLARLIHLALLVDTEPLQVIILNANVQQGG